ncbi:SET domain-containing protein 9 isoform X1 [Hyla sarda]|uniref:SET domain-containing protein 9 isoform X1 n=1 Tax=Hyla sarda TaxID=327740 RepID=UPI0024C35743|nr:SET domain-containing protein 9 isoform X1 [Hyla sarda]
MPPSPGSVLRALLTRWRSYKYRFVPWVALNLARNRRTLRYVSPGCSDKVTADAEVCSTLITFLRALFTSDITRQRDLLSLLPPSTCAMYPAPDGSHHQQCPHATHHADEVMYKCLGFSIDRHPSSLDEAGTGVFVSKGFVPKGALVSMYPGTVYQNYEPVFFQSIGNPFIFRCLDGILIDGNDKGISKSVYRSCSGRDQLGPLKMCDCTWLTSTPRNPLSVGQYINNCSNGNVHVSRTNCIQNICKKQCNKYMSGYFIHITRLLPAERAANVCYQEFDVPESFPVELRQYIPNVRYSHDVEGPLRCVVLVALRDIHCGEELFSNYFTLVQ